MSTYFAIRHVTRFSYDAPVSEELMEVRMQPRSEGGQRCLRFELGTGPRARVMAYLDHLGNSVHHFDTPARHTHLTITARAHVQLEPPAPLPDALPVSSWDQIDAWAASGEQWDFLHPSRYAKWTQALQDFARAADGSRSREQDPLTAVRHLTKSVHQAFEYVPKSTRVDSPIDEALAARRGVCQDFAHIMIAAARLAGLPARYVSGYIAPRAGGDERARAASAATHAWVEVLLPQIGWYGFDPTHNLEAGLRHIRVAIGRDYADVPPTRGIFKGDAKSVLAVSVEVTPSGPPTNTEPMLPEPQWASDEVTAAPQDQDIEKQMQAQQQQQQ